jgi:hypothetical protein
MSYSLGRAYFCEDRNAWVWRTVDGGLGDGEIIHQCEDAPAGVSPGSLRKREPGDEEQEWNRMMEEAEQAAKRKRGIREEEEEVEAVVEEEKNKDTTATATTAASKSATATASSGLQPAKRAKLENCESNKALDEIDSVLIRVLSFLSSLNFRRSLLDELDACRLR